MNNYTARNIYTNSSRRGLHSGEKVDASGNYKAASTTTKESRGSSDINFSGQKDTSSDYEVATTTTEES